MSDHWSTPWSIRDQIIQEFGEYDDPCPLHGTDGLDREWNDPVFINPPQSNIYPWIHRAVEHAHDGGTAILLVPVRPDARWWFHHVPEVRFFRKRITYGDGPNTAPFSSAMIIFRGGR